jgi:hypothetical protein
MTHVFVKESIEFHHYSTRETKPLNREYLTYQINHTHYSKPEKLYHSNTFHLLLTNTLTMESSKVQEIKKVVTSVSTSSETHVTKETMETVHDKASNPTVEAIHATGEPIPAIPISTILSDGAKKKKKSKKTGEKKKSSKKSKSSSSPKAHTMTSLYLDPLNDQQNVEAVETPKPSEALGQDAETLGDAEKAVENVEPNVEGSLNQSEKAPQSAQEENPGDSEHESAQEVNKSNIDANTKPVGEEEEILSAESPRRDEDIINLEDVDSEEIPLIKTMPGIARRLKDRKSKGKTAISESSTPTPAKPKKKVVGPSKSWSKVQIPSEKKKSLKRKKDASSDSEYDVEREVQDIQSSKRMSTLKKKKTESSDTESDVEPDVEDIMTSGRKKAGGLKIPPNVPDAPMDNISFHSVESSKRWKYVYQRRIALERELTKEGTDLKGIMELIEKAGMTKTVCGLGDCYERLVKEFLVNLSSECDNKLSPEFRKVFVRGHCVNFSPSIINNYLGRNDEDAAEVEVTDNQICKEITANQVNQWPIKGKLSASKLTVKYAILHRIGTVNWAPTNHTSTIATGLGKLIYIIGTKKNFDFGAYIFDQTMKHANSYAIRLPVAFPSIISGIITSQHPNIITGADVVSKRELPLTIHPRLFVGTHVLDIEAPAGKEVGVSTSKKAIIDELKATCKHLETTITESTKKKENLERLIAALLAEEDDGEEEGMEEDEASEEE